MGLEILAYLLAHVSIPSEKEAGSRSTISNGSRSLGRECCLGVSCCGNDVGQTTTRNCISYSCQCIGMIGVALATDPAPLPQPIGVQTQRSGWGRDPQVTLTYRFTGALRQGSRMFGLQCGIFCFPDWGPVGM